MYISNDYNFVYYGPSKNASTSVISLLVRDFKAIPVFVPNPPGDDPKPWPLGPHHSCFLPTIYRDYFKFTTVRNPFARAISWYNYLPSRDATRFVGEMNFQEFIEEMCHGKIQHNWRLDCWKYSQKNLIFGQPIRENCLPVELDRALKVENLAEELTNLPFMKGKQVKILQENRSPTTRQIVFPRGLVPMFVDKFREDFITFHYSTTPEFKFL